MKINVPSGTRISVARVTAVASLAWLLAACGGGGGGGSGGAAPSVQSDYTISVTVTGLASGGLTLELNGSDPLAVGANGTATFSDALATGTTYAVTIGKQPTSPAQTCTVKAGSGTVGTANVATVAVTCDAPVTGPQYSVTANVTGLTGSGLVLALNGGDDLALAANGGANVSGTFTTTLSAGSAYAVTIAAQPSGQICTLSGASGKVGAADVVVNLVCENNGTGPAIYTVTANVTGYTGTANLVLQLNGGAQVAVVQNGPATFSTKLSAGAGYLVAVIAQPTPPNQTCTVIDGQGSIATASVTVTVTCVTTNSVTVNVAGLSGSGLTLLLNGGAPLAITNNGTSAFSTQLNVGSTYSVTVATQPSSPAQNCTVSNGSGTILASYPMSYAMPAVTCPLVYVPSATNAWTWMTPAGIGAGLFGAGASQSTPSPLNYPAVREFGTSWTDAGGNIWVFGGLGAGDLGFQPLLNSVWEYTPSTGAWVQVAGVADSSLDTGGGVTGSYGTLGVGAAGNLPGSRYKAAAAQDGSGNLWLFGGSGFGASGVSQGFYAQPLNDLWEFTPGTGVWTWVSGANIAGGLGVYGQQGTGSTANLPGARQGAVSWVDKSGNVWIFGGQGYDASSQLIATLNDLWEFSPSAGTWTWVSGSVAGAAGASGPAGTYGTKGVAAVANVPGARFGSSAWTDGSGNLWLFGGYGNDSTGTSAYLNDLWKFNPATSQWTWVTGSSIGNQNGIYGTQGAASATGTPGGRDAASAVSDANGNFWLFGGGGLAATGTSISLSDLWMFNPTTAQWTWVSGSSAGGVAGSYGTPGVPAPGNAPGSRYGASFWAAGGNLWLFSGEIVQQYDYASYQSDLWVYTPAP